MTTHEILEHMFGSLAMLAGILTFLIGLSHQAWKQYKEKRFGLSIVFASLGATTCFVRIFYFILAEAWWTIPPDAVGLVITVIILYQYGAYEKKWWGQK